MTEQHTDWGDAPWLTDEPEHEPEDFEEFYYKPLSPKEKICDTCRIPKPCWC